jgi:hypothetical protein
VVGWNGSPHRSSRSCMSSIRSSLTTTFTGRSVDAIWTSLLAGSICAGEMLPGRSVHAVGIGTPDVIDGQEAGGDRALSSTPRRRIPPPI